MEFTETTVQAQGGQVYGNHTHRPRDETGSRQVSSHNPAPNTTRQASSPSIFRHGQLSHTILRKSQLRNLASANALPGSCPLHLVRHAGSSLQQSETVDSISPVLTYYDLQARHPSDRCQQLCNRWSQQQRLSAA